MRQYVGIVLVKSDGSVLAQHRDDKPNILGPNTWGVVGGARDNDHDLKAVACRELEEETDYKINPEDLRFLARDIYKTEKGTDVERTIFWAFYDGRQPINTNEGQEIRFIEPSEFNNLNFYTGHQAFLRKASEKTFGVPLEKKA